MNKTIRIGTRKSALAVAQTELVASALQTIQPEAKIELVTKLTEGDRNLEQPLLEFGGKGVFVAELEQALLSKEIDFAVHSAKDLPMELEDGLGVVAVCKRGDPRDVLVSLAGVCLEDKKEIVVGTSSLRRRLQIEEMGERLWPGSFVRCENLRGNIHTRLNKLSEGSYDAIILAAAGLSRVGLLSEERFSFHFFDCETFIPAGGQAVLAVEGRCGDSLEELAVRIQDEDTRLCYRVERRVLKLLDAGCQEPVGIYCRIYGEKLEVFGINRRSDGVKRIRLTGERGEADFLAEQAAKGLRG